MTSTSTFTCIITYNNKMRTDIFFEALKHTSFTSLTLGRREEGGGRREEGGMKGERKGRTEQL